MNISAHIEGRANIMFAEEKGLTLYTGDVSDLERKELSDNFEEKARYVRTPAGVKRFHKPIGSIIGGGGKLLPNISIEEPVFEDWDLVKGKNGKKYDVGKDGGKWAAYGHNDWDDLVATGKTQDEVLSALNTHVGGKGAGKARASQAQKKPHAKRLSSASELDKLRDGAWIQGDDEESTYRKEGGKWVRYGVTVQGTVEEDGRWPSSDLADGEESYEVTRPIPGAPKYTPKRSNESSRRPKGSVTEASSADVEPKDPSYRRGADRLRRAGVKGFHPNQARQVDEMTRDQWEEAQGELDNGASINDVLRKRAVGANKRNGGNSTSVPARPRSRAESRDFFAKHGVNYNDYEVIKKGEKNFNLSGAEADEYDKLTNPEKRRYFALRTDAQGRISQSHAGAMRDLKGKGKRNRRDPVAPRPDGSTNREAKRQSAGKFTSRASAIRRLGRLAGLSYADTESRYGDRLEKGNHSNMVTQQSVNALVRELEDTSAPGKAQGALF